MPNVTYAAYDNLAAFLAVTVSPPQLAYIRGFHSAGDGGEALYERQSTLIEPEGEELFPNGLDTWTLVSGWALTNGRLTPVPPAEYAKAEGTFNITATAGSRYRFTCDVLSSGGRWSFSLLNSFGYSERTFLPGSTGDGNPEIEFEVRPGNNKIQINGDDFVGSIGDISLKQIHDYGQQDVTGFSYLPIPLNGILRPEMFGAGYEEDDDSCFRKFFQRVNMLARDGVNIRIEMRRRYTCIETRHLVCVAKDTDIFIDGHGGIVDLTGADPNETNFWLEFMGPGYDGLRPGEQKKTTLKEGKPSGSLEIPVWNNAGFSDGDWIAITSTWEYWGGITERKGYGRINAGELSQINRYNAISSSFILGDRTSFAYNQHATLPLNYPVNVRRIVMAGRFHLDGLRGIGPGMGEEDKEAGTALLNVWHFASVNESGVIVENFPGSSICYTLCASLNLVNPKTIGRRFDISQIDSEWFYGREILGCARSTIVAPVGEYCRRAVDLHEASGGTPAGDLVPGEGIIAKNIAITGGYSIECQTMPLGHHSYNVTLTGHIGHATGLQIRGRNVRVVNCHTNTGASLGAAGGANDPDTYPYDDPTQGDIELIGCTFSNAAPDEWGLEVRQSISSLRIHGCDIMGAKPISFYGRHQSNIIITNSTISGLPGDETPSNPVIAFWINGTTPESVVGKPADPQGRPWLVQKISSKNIRIEGNRLMYGTYAILHSGCKAEDVSNFRVKNNTFEQITTAHLRLFRNIVGGLSRWGSDGSIELIDNIECTRDSIIYPLPTFKTNIGDVVVSQCGNNFSNAPMSVGVVSNTIAVPAAVGGSIVLLNVTGASVDVHNITGLKQGQTLIIQKPEGGTLTFLHHWSNSGNIHVGTSKFLTASAGRIAFIGAESGQVMFLYAVENA